MLRVLWRDFQRARAAETMQLGMRLDTLALNHTWCAGGTPELRSTPISLPECV